VFQVSEVALLCYVPHQGACGSALKIFSIILNTIQIHYKKKKVKQSHDRPRQTPRVPGS